MSLSELLFGGWGDAFSDVMTLGTEMVSTATERVKTGIADFFEDPVATARQATMETTERIANAGGARQYFEKPEGPELGVEPGDVELGVIKATKNTITEILHDLPEIGGKGLVGTYDMNNVDDLQELLGKIKKNHAWEDVTQSTAKVDVDARLSRWENKEFGGRGSEAIELQEFKPPTVKELAKEFKADGMSGKSAVKAARAEQEELIDANASLKESFGKYKAGGMSNREAMRAARQDVAETPAVPREPELGDVVSLERQGATYTVLERQSVTLGEHGIELSDLTGTGTNPTELRLYSNVQSESPGAIELLELKTVELPGSELVRTVVPIPSEIPEPTPWGPGSKIQPFEIEEPQSVQIQNLRD